MEWISFLGIILLTLTLSVVINFLFTMFHLYMRSKSEYQLRLLNVLYSHLALILQFGTLVNMINILRCLLVFDSKVFNTGVELTRTVQVVVGFVQSTLLGLCTILHNFNKVWYLKLSTSFNGDWILPVVLLTSSSLVLTAWSLTPAWQDLSFLTCKVLILFSLGCYLLVFSDLTTQYLQTKIETLRQTGAGVCVRSRRVAPLTPETVTLGQHQQAGVLQPRQQEGNCLHRQDHISFSIGFLTILMFISVVYVASMMMEVSQVTEWGVSVVGLVMSTITASLWVLGNDKLREFTGETIRGMFSIPG